jgi:hypothetical protein
MDARIFHIDRLHPEAVCPQMLDPRTAAASSGALVDLHAGLCVGAAREQDERRSEVQQSVRKVSHQYLLAVINKRYSAS